MSCMTEEERNKLDCKTARGRRLMEKAKEAESKGEDVFL